MNNLSDNRIEFIDLAKGFCILLVVFNHVAEGFTIGITSAISSFRMPLYFLVSGLFFKAYSFSEFCRKKTNKLLIPFVFFYIFIALLIPLVVNIVYPGFSQNSGLNYIFAVYNENFNGSPMGIWFLWCLFLENFIFYFLLILSQKTKKVILTLSLLSIILGIAGFLLFYCKIDLPLYIDTAFTSLPFFCVGYIMKKYSNILYPNKYDKYLFGYTLICFVVIFLLASGESFGYRINSFSVNIITLYLCGILGTLGVIFISKKIKRIPFISFMGRYSIMILCSHQVVILLIRQFVEKLNLGDIPSVGILFVITSIISYLLIFPMKKFLPYVTAQKDIL